MIPDAHSATRPGDLMSTIKNARFVIPVVLLTAVAVLGVAALVGLSSWALL